MTGLGRCLREPLSGREYAFQDEQSNKDKGRNPHIFNVLWNLGSAKSAGAEILVAYQGAKDGLIGVNPM